VRGVVLADVIEIDPVGRRLVRHRRRGWRWDAVTGPDVHSDLNARVAPRRRYLGKLSGRGRTVLFPYVGMAGHSTGGTGCCGGHLGAADPEQIDRSLGDKSGCLQDPGISLILSCDGLYQMRNLAGYSGTAVTGAARHRTRSASK
jgi:hypothetical protein